MARPKKQIVDYFPHSCTSGKTLFVLEQEYGNDGYSFWFKLLEELGNTPGHYIDYNNIQVQRFIAAKTRVSVTITQNMLQLLSELDAIDPKLWSNGIIWSQNFIDNIYNEGGIRRVEKPIKPSLVNNNTIKSELLQQKPSENADIADLTGEREREREIEKERNKKELLQQKLSNNGPVDFLTRMRDRYLIVNPNYSASEEDIPAMFEILEFIRGQTKIEQKLYELSEISENILCQIWDSWVQIISKKHSRKSLSEIAKFKKTEISNWAKEGLPETKPKSEKNGIDKGQRFNEDFSEVIFPDGSSQKLNHDQSQQAKHGLINPKAIVKGIFN